ncbi:lipopolysaccharide kinase InaA family protein [Fuchsiella alkaliacetigena]|uniref:lipopolysaccharide kinase InaA family protein n=1 Tax=Fuchsiella alkaliacetigena TaxID=957042 RepID=UPI00200AF368|nr:lipopolysaccharide kinase InaA family protein [Fuchsiella alkaliacetigena]MCK8824300.1 hypothetical protein [Fuchsiella alkaliacetigena]
MEVVKKEYAEVKVYNPLEVEIDFDFIAEIKDYLLFAKDSYLSFELVKEDKSDVYRLEYKKEPFYVKHYSYKSFNKIAKRFFRGAYGVKNLKTAVKLLAAGINAVQPIATLVYKRNFLFVDSIFIMKEVEGFDLYDYLAENNFSYQFKRKLIIKLAKLWAELYNNKFLHKDPNLFNLFINWDNGDFNLSLVDIDNIYKLPFIPKKLVVKNLFKFNERLIVNCNELGLELGKKELLLFCTELVDALQWDNIDLKSFIDQVIKGTKARLKRKQKEHLWYKYSN